MELVWLVYGISLLSSLNAVSFFIAFFGTVAAVSLWIITIVDDAKVHRGFLWFITILPVFSAISMVLLPSEKTAYTMVAAYATQKVVERPETQEAVKDVLTIINSKVKQYALESVKELEKATNK